MKLNQAVLFGFSIGCGVVLSTWIGSSAYRSVRSDAISVKGFAERRIRSDTAVWKATVIVRDSTLPRSYLKLDRDVSKVLAFLRKHGFSEEAVVKASVQVITIYERKPGVYESNRIEGYRLEQSIKISSKDINVLLKVSQGAAELISEGIEIQAQAPEFFYSALDGLKVELLGEAAKDARTRALQLATSSGNKLGKLRGASQGVFQITQPNSTEVSGYGMYDTTTIDKSVRVVVTMNYAVE